MKQMVMNLRNADTTTMKSAVKCDIDLQGMENFSSLPSHALIERWINTALSYLHQKVKDATDKRKHTHYSLSICMVNEQESAALNAKHRDKAYATNVLSFRYVFPIPDTWPTQPLGDLVLCPAVIVREAVEQQKTLEAHWAHLLVHGTLHLRGYDHEQANDAAAMEHLEIKILEQLNYPNPYLENSEMIHE